MLTDIKKASILAKNIFILMFVPYCLSIIHHDIILMIGVFSRCLLSRMTNNILYIIIEFKFVLLYVAWFLFYSVNMF